MKLSALVLGSLMAVSVSAKSTYRISLYSKTDFQGDQATFTEEYDISILARRFPPSDANGVPCCSGSHKVGWSGGAQSWIFESEPGDGCCVAFCRGSTNVGRYCESAYKTESSAGTTKVVTGCGDTVLNC
ncbi:hypothetical protein LTR99_003290 [Exophiala xenobiotica]|uniref:Uncharacterized protein n=1 Tax=Vermiconidia calcicola TaxID=1690605 RepID=A0AAV9QB34_9PEZI|nr:hypothetical protein LTR72_009067 [Exophiala xenobiotica]KAK5538957.1 hypothetical protein LTR25_004501 [Vermiconidia calcicola]KAK5540473.1 hypothetical protein LTR23_006155 [Chaetothyriales sp. CCFEE 6169]KAK5262725.1 hypothetical protein LTR40_014901 [Exophiala xenobiotica]KAK5288585.1 hypothetical protein LTR14_007935 [Exophiala xenobiotica]